MIENKDFQKAIELINKSSSILITINNKPNGDACDLIEVFNGGVIILVCNSIIWYY
jgi:hypothetical protein